MALRSVDRVYTTGGRGYFTLGAFIAAGLVAREVHSDAGGGGGATSRASP